MARKSPRPSLKSDTAVEGITQSALRRLFGGLGGIEYRLSIDDYVSGEELAAAIQKDAGQILSDRVRDYLCRLLRGEVKKKPGPNRSREKKLAYKTIGLMTYRQELARLQAERKAPGGRRLKREKPAHEEAALIVQQQYEYFRHMSPRAIANLFSSRK